MTEAVFPVLLAIGLVLVFSFQTVMFTIWRRVKRLNGSSVEKIASDEFPLFQPSGNRKILGYIFHPPTDDKTLLKLASTARMLLIFTAVDFAGLVIFGFVG